MPAKFIAAAVLLASGAAVFAQPAYSAHRPRSHHHTVAVQPERHIACTVVGCMPVPATCGQTYGRTPGGIPTGFDVIVCPPGQWPFP